jgi:maltooligosyltrehalose trehalohydrolase
MNLKVWAPSAKSVELVTPQRRIAMRPAAKGPNDGPVPGDGGELGIWQAEVEESLLSAGYRYSIDGGDPIPDPRSTWQPEGVHGASHVAGIRGQARHFVAKPLNEAVIYEMHVGTFTPEGTYAAAEAKLSHLAELGITHVELMPLATFPGRRGWGYDGVSLYAPFPSYGTPRELAAFVQSCHARGLAVLLDVVYNHLGPDGNYLGQYGPYFTNRYKTGWGSAVNYDGPQSDQVRRFIIDNALMWLRDYGFDGLRLDAVHAIFSFDAVPVLEELSLAVKEFGEKAGRQFVLIAESDLNDPRLVRPVSQGGFALDAQWADDFHHAIHRFFTDEHEGYYADFQGLADVATALRDGYVYQGQYSPYRGRRHGRPPNGIAADQLVVCAQNHDQIGNRAQGERLSMMVGTPQLKAIAALTLLSPFVPMLFQGEEWGATTPFLYFTDHENAELGRLVAQGRSREFDGFRWQGAVPNPQEPATFEHSKLKWSELKQPAHAELYEWHRRLIQLRGERTERLSRAGRGKSAVADRGKGGAADRGKAQVSFDAGAQFLSFAYGAVLCAFNFSGMPQRMRPLRGAWNLVLRSDGLETNLPAELPAHATFIFTQRKTD